MDTACPGLSGCSPVRFTPFIIPADQPGAGYYIGSGSYWISQMNQLPLHYDYNCCQPAVYVQPDSPGPDCTNGIFVAMPPAVCDGLWGSLWMGRVDQSISDAHACDNYVANRNNGIGNPPSCDPQIELDLIWHGPAAGFETFVAPLGFPTTQPICDRPSINSLDRYLEVKVPEACVDAVGGVTKFGLRLAGADGETYDVALKDARIYQTPAPYNVDILDDSGQPMPGQHLPVQEGAFFPNDEVQRMDPNDCLPPVAVSHEGGFYRFVTVFNAITSVRVSLTRDGQVVAGWDYFLKAHTDMSDLIQQLDGVLTESWCSRGPFPAYTLQPYGLNAQFAVLNRSLIAKCCSAVFEQVESAVQAGVVLQVQAVRIAVIGAQGVVQGFWAGVNNDKNNVTQFYNLIRHPIDTSKSLYEGFRGLVSMGWDGLKQVPKKMLDEYLTEAEKNIAWADPRGNDPVALVAYTVGYSAGYGSEQLLVSTLLGVFKAAVAVPALTTMGSKIATMMSAVKAGQHILRGVQTGREVMAKVQTAKNLAVRAANQFVKEKAGLDRLEGMAKTLLPLLGCPGMF